MPDGLNGSRDEGGVDAQPSRACGMNKKARMAWLFGLRFLCGTARAWRAGLVGLTFSASYCAIAARAFRIDHGSARWPRALAALPVVLTVMLPVILRPGCLQQG